MKTGKSGVTPHLLMNQLSGDFFFFIFTSNKYNYELNAKIFFFKEEK